MTALRTPDALAQTARAAQRPWVRPVKLLIAALAAFFVPLSPVLFDGAARVAFTLVFAAEAVLLVTDAALARKTARQLRRACEGDFSPASIRVTDTACEFVRGGAQTHMEHAPCGRSGRRAAAMCSSGRDARPSCRTRTRRLCNTCVNTRPRRGRESCPARAGC